MFLRRLAVDASGFSRAQQRRLVRCRRLLESVPSMGSVDEIGLMFRVGRAAAPSARTGRLAPTQILARGVEDESV